MSIDASKWARTADVQKSSSKLVLLELAHLVRPYATDWTVFASIDHLARVTHLNRKTVIETLARLRELGAIVDTGLRAGGSRSCPVYRLCPTAVPTVCAPVADTAAGNGAPYQPSCQPSDQVAHQLPDTQGALALDELAAETAPTWQTDLDEDRGAAVDLAASGILDVPTHANEAAGEYLPQALAVTAPALVADDAAPCAAESNDTTPAPTQAQPAIEAPSIQVTSAPIVVPSQPQAAATALASPPPRTRRTMLAKGASSPAAGAGASRLPADWVLPARWRVWTHHERPHWSAEKIDAMVLTFCAYWRSKPGHSGLSEDWFASWRLWVFRERETRAAGAAWHSTWSGIVAKGRGLGLEQAPGELEQAFRMRVHRAAGVPLPY